MGSDDADLENPTQEERLQSAWKSFVLRRNINPDFGSASVEDLELFLLEEKAKHATQSYYDTLSYDREKSVNQVLEHGSAKQLRELLVKPDNEIIRDLWRRCERILPKATHSIVRDGGYPGGYSMIVYHVRTNASEGASLHRMPDSSQVLMEIQDLLKACDAHPRDMLKRRLQEVQSHIYEIQRLEQKTLKKFDSTRKLCNEIMASRIFSQLFDWRSQGFNFVHLGDLWDLMFEFGRGNIGHGSVDDFLLMVKSFAEDLQDAKDKIKANHRFPPSNYAIPHVLAGYHPNNQYLWQPPSTQTLDLVIQKLKLLESYLVEILRIQRTNEDES